VDDAAALDTAFARCAAEALTAFGHDALYAERLIRRARHVEVQVAGDGAQVAVLGERDCTLQRRFQKLVEIAPAPGLPAAQRDALHAHARRMAQQAGLRSLATFEFLLDLDAPEAGPVFIEANARLQVEHTVTEAVTGLDLVQLQIALAAGATLAALGLDAAQAAPAHGLAIQWRINAEQQDAQGQPRPAGGRLTRCDWPQGPGLRVDTHAEPGHAPSPLHDTLLAKVIVHHPSAELGDALRRSQRALAECRLDGVATNLPLLRALAAALAASTEAPHTRWIDTHAGQLWPAQAREPGSDGTEPSRDVDATLLRAPMSGRVAQIDARAGQMLGAGACALVLSAMKMEHAIALPRAARIDELRVAVGDLVAEGAVLLCCTPLGDADQALATAETVDPEAPRADLARLRERLSLTLDSARPEAMARRHAAGGRSARENIADFVDAGSFSEYGALSHAAQTRRRPLDELIRQTPADGLIAGVGTVNAALFGPERARCALLAYDYTVLAGTQGLRNHAKTDRLLELAARRELPLVLWAEGGGGRPGDVDAAITAGLHVPSFRAMAALAGRVPTLAIVHGRCFAGNAALAGVCDLVIATRGANLGMGGPAMIEGGGLGQVRPEQIGPVEEQARAAVVDLLVDDEAQANAAARRILGLFQGDLAEGRAGDARLLRHLVPKHRLRAVDMRAVMHALVDEHSLVELGAAHGAGMITALARIGGRAVGLIANHARHLGGAIDAAAADKAARFVRLCDARGLPVASLCDTPGFMVGPEAEREGLVRKAAGLFVAGAAARVPWFTIVVRRGFGLGAMAMAGGGFHAGDFTVAWPGAEFGAMGLEGAVRLGYRKELEAQTNAAERDALFQRLLAQQIEAGSALAMAGTFEIDAVIDPAETRDWLIRGLAAHPRR
jgi:acetyl-CoA carboxylase carboxyltransferase component/biotin carboxyl carrier protein